MNVAEFIDGSLAEDEHDFENASYRKVYDEYFRMYDEGLTQEQIQTRLLNSMDEAEVVIGITYGYIEGHSSIEFLKILLNVATSLKNEIYDIEIPVAC